MGKTIGGFLRACCVTLLTISVVCDLVCGGGEVVRDALASVMGFVDKCVVLDTGITDDTLVIVREAAGKKLVVVPWTWRGDFAAARNAALDAVRRNMGGYTRHR